MTKDNMTKDDESAYFSRADAIAPLLVGGRDRVTDEVIAVTNPATHALIGSVSVADKRDVDDAVRAAVEAQRGWARTSPSDRAAALVRLADLIDSRAEELARLETAENGMPIALTRGQVAGASALLRYFAGGADKVTGRTIPADSDGLLLTVREPIGVAALITPWNAPLTIAALKAAPALAVGNTVVLKPSELAPLTTQIFGDLAREAGFPPGTVNVLTGRGDVGAALVEHPGIGKISFTGSTATGRAIAESAARTFKRVTLELGGKSAAVVFPDADLERVGREAPLAVFGMMGEDCCARSRLIVHEDVRDEVVERFAATAERLKVGDPMDDDTVLGPLITPSHRDRVHSAVQESQADGARVVTGGEGPSELDHDRGYYRPTVLDRVQPGARILREELFGPVMTVETFSTRDEAVHLANNTEFGLAASVWTADVGRAISVSRDLRCGAVVVNGNTSVHLQAPMGGYKSSGMGREYSLEALEQNTEVKTVFLPAG